MALNQRNPERDKKTTDLGHNNPTPNPAPEKITRREALVRSFKAAIAASLFPADGARALACAAPAVSGKALDAAASTFVNWWFNHSEGVRGYFDGTWDAVEPPALFRTVCGDLPKTLNLLRQAKSGKPKDMIEAYGHASRAFQNFSNLKAEELRASQQALQAGLTIGKGIGLDRELPKDPTTFAALMRGTGFRSLYEKPTGTSTTALPATTLPNASQVLHRSLSSALEAPGDNKTSPIGYPGDPSGFVLRLNLWGSATPQASEVNSEVQSMLSAIRHLCTMEQSGYAALGREASSAQPGFVHTFLDLFSQGSAGITERSSRSAADVLAHTEAEYWDFMGYLQRTMREWQLESQVHKMDALGLSHFRSTLEYCQKGFVRTRIALARMGGVRNLACEAHVDRLALECQAQLAAKKAELEGRHRQRQTQKDNTSQASEPNPTRNLAPLALAHIETYLSALAMHGPVSVVIEKLPKYPPLIYVECERATTLEVRQHTLSPRLLGELMLLAKPILNDPSQTSIKFEIPQGAKPEEVLKLIVWWWEQSS